MTDADKAQDTRLASMVAQGGRLRALVLELWQRTRIDWGFVTDRLAVVFRREKWLGASERRFVAETVYGLVRHLRRIDAAVTAGGRRGASVRDEQRLLAYLVLEHGLPPGDAARLDPDLDWRAVAGIDAHLAAERRPSARIAIGCSLPDWLAAQLVADWGADAEPLARALNQRAPMTVRANTLIGDRDALAASLAGAGLQSHPGAWSSTALIIDSRTNLFGLEAFKRGAFEAQDEGSQLIAELVAPPPRGNVVDLCAGAGGKTLALSALMGSRGRLIAADIEERKLEELRKRARRAQVSNARAVTLPARDWPPGLVELVGKADRVLVDAPCSGVGALRRNPEARWRLQPADILELRRTQRQIIERGLELVAPGGHLIYATCTVLAAENREVVDAVVADRPGVEIVPIAAVWGEARGAALAGVDGRFMEVTPHRHGTDGFFAAVLRRAP